MKHTMQRHTKAVAVLACRNRNRVDGRHEGHVNSVEGKLDVEVAQKLELLEKPSRHHPNVWLGGANEIEETSSLKDIEARLLGHADKRSGLYDKVINRRKEEEAVLVIDTLLRQNNLQWLY